MSPIAPIPKLFHRLLPVLALQCGLALPAAATEATQQAIEKALQAAQQDKKGITLHVHGQAIGGAVVRVEPGQVVELKSQQYGRIVVRLDRIDAVMMP